MDSTSGPNGPHHIGIKASSLQYPNTRKRSRGSSEDDDVGGAAGVGAGTGIISPSTAKEEKRLKARERQRRKRERDRSGRDKSGGPSSSSMVTLSSTSAGGGLPVGVPGVAIGVFSPSDEETPQIMNMYGHHHPPDGIPNVADPISNPSATSTPNGHGSRGSSGGGRGPGPSDSSNLTPEEMAKKDRIRLAARERQRKHRAAVKAKRMAEMGISIVAPGVEQPAIHYVLNEHGQYDPVMQDPTTHHHPHQHQHPPLPPSHPHGQPSHPHSHFQVLPEPPFPVPQPHMTPGQTFAQTLLLSISCTPMLKQHLLRSLHMSEEELGSLEPMIASAWDHWAHDRALHYATANTSVPGSDDHNAPSTSYNMPPHPPNLPGPTPPNHNPAQASTTAAGTSANTHNLYSTDFRERFQRPLVAPFPSNAPILRSMHHPSQPPPNGSSSTNGSFRADRREDGADSDGRDERDERKRSPPTNANTTTDSIDPNLESEGTSHVRTAEPGKNGNITSSQHQQKRPGPPTDKKMEAME